MTIPLVLTPGASTAVVLRNSLSGGIRAGLMTTLGANAGSVCYGILCAFGLAIVLEQWPGIWGFLRTAGILYLAWLGAQSLGRAWRPSHPHEDSTPGAATQYSRSRQRTPSVQDLREGFLTNVMNPALMTFYFVILPQFIPRGASVAGTALALTAVHVTLAASWHTVWAVAGGTLAHLLSARRPRQLLDLASGLAMLFLAVRLGLS